MNLTAAQRCWRTKIRRRRHWLIIGARLSALAPPQPPSTGSLLTGEYWNASPTACITSPHRSAAVIFGLGHLPADRHEFTLPVRRQSRRADVRLHHRDLDDGEWISRQGMLVTRPSRIAADLLTDHEDPEAVGHLVADAIRAVYDYPSNFADSLARSAAHFGLRRGDGIGLLRWLLDLVGDPDTQRWMGRGSCSRRY